MIALSVNLNKIALIRNSRDTTNPDVPEHARIALAAGADGITVHPRPDQRHIRASDCFELAELLANAVEAPIELNIEGNPFAGPRTSDRRGVGDYPGFMALIEAIKPAQCTLVPDANAQLTSDHGFDLKQDAERLAPLLESLRSMGVRTSLFMDPEPEQIKLAAEIGTDRIELYTEPYADAFKANSDLEGVYRQYHD
ncbi:MAG: pyridoxine 5'-phosphate synthase, partial [Lysobacterales bacterium]